MASISRVILGLLLFWMFILMYMSSTLFQSNDFTERTERQLAKAIEELGALKNQNNELKNLATELQGIQSKVPSGKGHNSALVKLQNQLKEANDELDRLNKHKDGVKHNDGVNINLNQPGNSDGPSLEHEKLRRKIENGVTEIWYYVKSQLQKTKKKSDNSAVKESIDEILQDGTIQQRSILTDLLELSEEGETDKWRQREADELSKIVQNRLHYLQNPSDCESAKKLVCNINKGCGYGCQLHHVVYCFIIAYGTGRTLILDSTGWRYNPQGWEAVFKPVSDTCTERGFKSPTPWGGDENRLKDVQVVSLPIVDSLHPRPAYMPLAIPEDLAPRLIRLHGNPFVWWVGQFMKYLLRPQASLAEDMAETKDKLGFESPIVGVHVRRTDKVGTEAAFHSIDEYMVHVEEYYARLARRQTVHRKRVYLATDEPNLLAEAKQKYPSYVFISDTGISQTAGLNSRYSSSSLRGVILDIHFLSLTDHLVCTFSSQVCRVAYEIMQHLHPDASSHFNSLDDIYYYGGQNAHNLRAIYEHSPKSMQEIGFEPGDVIGMAGNHWNGFSMGSNRQNSKSGLFPSYKVEEIYNIVKFPTYSEADKKGKR